MQLQLLQSCTILVTTFAFPRNRHHCALLRPERCVVSKGSNDVRGPRVRPKGSGYRGNDGERARTCIRRHFWLATLLHRVALLRTLRRRHRRCGCRCCGCRRRRFEGHNFFLKTVSDIGHPQMRKKIACIGIRFSVATVVTMVVTTIT